MKYGRLMMLCAAEVWALEPDKLVEVAQFLMFKAAGGHFDEAEIEARTAGARETGRIAPDAPGAIAVLPVYGVLAQRANMVTDFSGGTSMQAVAGAVQAALTAPGIKAIVLDIDSPGGTVFGTVELAQEIYASRGVKPIIAQVNSVAASAAYWIASAADEIVVTPGGQAGSIGVYRIHEDVSKMLEKEGVATTVIKAGRFKMEDHPFAPLGQEARDAMQARVDQSYQMFVQAVARGRRVTPATVLDRFGQGRMFGAAELIARGMADRVATLTETLDRLGASPLSAASSYSRHFADMRTSLGNLSQHLKVR